MNVPRCETKGVRRTHCVLKMKCRKWKEKKKKKAQKYTSPTDRTHLIIISYRIGSTRVCIPHTIELYTRKKHMFCSFSRLLLLFRLFLFFLYFFHIFFLRFRFLLNGQYSVHTHYITFVYNLYITLYTRTIPYHTLAVSMQRVLSKKKEHKPITEKP